MEGGETGQLVPPTENVWKIILFVAEQHQILAQKDKLTMRLVCEDARHAVDPYVQFSQTKFDTLIKQIQQQKYSITDELTTWLEIEKNIDSLIIANENNPKFQARLNEWIDLMWARGDEPPHVLIAKTQHYVTTKYRPSFRRAFRKMRSGAIGGACAVGAVAAAPFALISLPLLVCGCSSAGYCLGAPFVIAAKTAFDRIDDATREPNIRNRAQYSEIQQCIERVKAKLNESVITK